MIYFTSDKIDWCIYIGVKEVERLLPLLEESSGDLLSFKYFLQEMVDEIKAKEAK